MENLGERFRKATRNDLLCPFGFLYEYFRSASRVFTELREHIYLNARFKNNVNDVEDI